MCEREHLTRIRLQRAIYLCLRRGSLPENDAERQPRFGAKPVPKISEKNYMSDKIEAFGFIRLVTPQCLSGADTGLETVRGCNKGLKLR